MAATVFESRNSWCQKNKNLIATNISGFKKIPRIIFWLLHSNKNRPKKTWVVHVLKGNAGGVAYCARPLVLHEAVGARKVPLEPLTERSVALPLWEILWFHWTHFLSLNRVNFFFFFFGLKYHIFIHVSTLVHLTVYTEVSIWQTCVLYRVNWPK